MRQAGRYMPEYRALRQKASFLELCRTPELAAEVTMLPIDLLDVDAAIIFSDILVILELFGKEFDFIEGHGPKIENPISTPEAVKLLEARDAKGGLQYVAQAIRLLLPRLKVPLIGFCGAPFTIASYMIEGGSSREFHKTKNFLYTHPDAMHQLLTKITDATIDYMLLQQEAGVAAIQLFDSWAGVLGFQAFHSFSLRYLDRIVRQWHRIGKVPLILFARKAGLFAQDLVQLRPSALSFDEQTSLSQIRMITPENIALQGNLDPELLYAPIPIIQKEATRLLQEMSDDPGFIFNLGHGIKPDIPFSHVKALVDLVKNYRS
jgi:uroporphyrinogen decarboxylase